jgi:hypothetical protein
MAAGELKVVAISDLRGLGAKEGAPVSYRWTLPSLIPLLLPWLAILLLLLVKSNRCGRAWWIWLPLGCLAAAVQLLQPAFAFLSSETADIFLELAGALAFGIAAVWLLAPQLTRRHRFVTFLCFAPTLAGFSIFSYLVRQDWTWDGVPLALAMLVPLSLNVLVVALAIFLAGLACRGRYRPLGLYLWIFLSLLALWLMILTPFFAFAMIASVFSGGQVPWSAFSAFFVTIPIITAVSFAILLPFLVLSSANSLFRERLKLLLHLGREIPPPLNTPPVPNPAA